MKEISIRSTGVLSILAVVSMGLLFLVEYTKKEQPQNYYEEKLLAAQRMQLYMDHIKFHKFSNEIAIDNINDPNDTRIIGTRYSSITSGRGSLPIKLSTTNPNFAAVILDLFKEAGLNSGDHIAVGATGSFPALNLAFSAAAEEMNLDVTFISSVTSSSWGATDPEFTFLDMHKSLQEAGLIKFPIIASSIGANQDNGQTLSPEGRDAAVQAIKRNDIQLISNPTLYENIEERVAIIFRQEQQKGKNIKLYVNIGGGVASLGSLLNSQKLGAGLQINPKLNLFEDKKGMMFEMAARKVNLLNLHNLQGLINKYELPNDPVPLPQPGEGSLFLKMQYDLMYVYGSISLLALAIILIILFDRKQNALGNQIVKTEAT